MRNTQTPARNVVTNVMESSAFSIASIAGPVDHAGDLVERS
jgi:hypothetical protein